ncbi:uncharacterized protein [Miscanthus floridulus]|uniref:uncharacterized protein n=1 Tax=Miscanthus floridulus TaxID=154761 RepID=UPI00345B390D
MACKPYYNTNSCTGRHATNTPSFPRPPAPPQPPLLPLPPQYSFQPVSRPAPRAKKPRRYDAAPGASAPIAVAEPSKKRVAPATATGLDEELLEWTETAADSLYSVSPPPSSVPMPTSLLLTVTAARTKAPTACAVEVVAGAGSSGVDVGATDELRRILRL